jgi:hypothetical protein
VADILQMFRIPAIHTTKDALLHYLLESAIHALRANGAGTSMSPVMAEHDQETAP